MNNYRCWFFTFIAASLLYIATLAPDIVWQDQGDYQYHAAKMTLNRPGDVVRVHPLFIITAHLVGRTGLFSFAYSANLVSAISSAIAIANIFVIVRLLTGNFWASLLASAICALGHSTWFLAVQAQSYGLANATLTGCFVLIILFLKNPKDGYLYWMGFIAGVGVTAHMMSQIGFAAIMLYLLILCFRKKLSVAVYSKIIFCWVIGAGLLWYVIAIEYGRSGDLIGTFLSAIYGKWGKAVFNVDRIWHLLKNSFLFFVLNFPTPLVLLAIPGIGLGIKKTGNAFAKILAGSLILYVLFAIRYDVPNQNNFFLPTYIIISIYVGLGFDFVFSKKGILPAVLSVLFIALIPLTYILISNFAEKKQIALGTKRYVPYRNVYRYYLLPWQQNQKGPRRLVSETFGKVPANSILMPDSTLMRCFLYAHEIENLRPDIKLIPLSVKMPDAVRDGLSAGNRIFVFSDTYGYYPQWIDDIFRLEPFQLSETEHIFEVRRHGLKPILQDG